VAVNAPIAPRRGSGDRDDRGLAARAAAGDEQAFTALYDRHAPALLAFACQYVGDRATAEDVVQQTFLAAHRVLREGTQLEHPRAWLFHVARNNALSAVRDRPPAGVAADLSDELLDRAAAVPAQVERREALEEVVRDIVALPAEQRAALALFELGDMSQTEIAEALACKPEKVKALVFQARTSLTSQREARSASCASVREKLATFHGGALNQRMIRLHLRHCRPCTAYRDELRDRRRKLALLLPVLPLPGMREAVLGAFGGGAGAAAHAPGLGAVRRAHWAAAGTAATVVVAGVALAGWPSGHDRREAAVRRPPPAAVPMSSAPVAAPRRAKRPARDPAPRRRRAHAAELAPRVAARAAHPRPVVERTAGPVAPEALRPRPSPAPPPKATPEPAASPEPTVPLPPAATAEPVVAAPPPPPPCSDHSNASDQGLANGQGHSKCNDSGRPASAG